MSSKEISDDVLKKEIAEILKNANLNTTSAKKVRQKLESKLKVDLSKRKDEIADMIMDYIDKNKSDYEESEEEPEAAESEDKSEPEENSEEEKPKKRKAASKKSTSRKKKAHSSDDEDEEPKSKTKKKSKGGGGGRGGGYTRPLKLSPALAKLMGKDSMARHEVVKQVWAIIKERNLYDPNNKQFAICDNDLQKVFGTKRFRTFGMMKYLKDHFYDD